MELRTPVTSKRKGLPKELRAGWKRTAGMRDVAIGLEVVLERKHPRRSLGQPALPEATRAKLKTLADKVEVEREMESAQKRKRAN